MGKLLSLREHGVELGICSKIGRNWKKECLLAFCQVAIDFRLWRIRWLPHVHQIGKLISNSIAAEPKERERQKKRRVGESCWLCALLAGRGKIEGCFCKWMEPSTTHDGSNRRDWPHRPSFTSCFENGSIQVYRLSPWCTYMFDWRMHSSDCQKPLFISTEKRNPLFLQSRLLLSGEEEEFPWSALGLFSTRSPSQQ